MKITHDETVKQANVLVKAQRRLEDAKTAHEKASKELRDAQSEYATLMNSLPDPYHFSLRRLKGLPTATVKRFEKAGIEYVYQFIARYKHWYVYGTPEGVGKASIEKVKTEIESVQP